MFMQSSGGLVDAHMFQGKDAILSGPAGGIVGAVRVSALAGFAKIITFDMGGTSTDVAHYAGDYERSFESEVAGVRMRAPMMAIHTVAAGGGSILAFDGARFRVGPESAGADPGPACYRKGGPADRDRRQRPGRQAAPALFPEGVRAGRGSAARRPDRAAKVRTARGRGRGRDRDPRGRPRSWRTAASRSRSTTWRTRSRRSRSSAATTSQGYVLCCFGGAAGQHACWVADSLGLKRVLVHPLASVLSAYGMGLADVRTLRQRALEAPLEDALLPKLEATIAELADEARAELARQSLPAERISGGGARPHPLQRHRHLARDRGRRPGGDGRGVRDRAPRPLRLRGRGPRARGRAGHGRGDRPHGRDRRARAAGRAARRGPSRWRRSTRWSW